MLTYSKILPFLSLWSNSYPYTLPSVSFSVFGTNAELFSEPGYDVIECFRAWNNVEWSR